MPVLSGISILSSIQQERRQFWIFYKLFNCFYLFLLSLSFLVFSFYLTNNLCLSFCVNSSNILFSTALTGFGRECSLSLISLKLSKGFFSLSFKISVVCFLPKPGSNSN